MRRLVLTIYFLLVCCICSLLGQAPSYPSREQAKSPAKEESRTPFPTPTPPGQVQDEPHAWIDATAIWKETSGKVRLSIPVCWENSDAKFNGEMDLVKQAVADSWEAASALSFTNWAACAPNNAGIRILIDDSGPDNGPHTKGLGNRLDKKPNGMVLNFTFNNWGQGCKSTPELKNQCIKSIAVHEFGHAIGFAHEHNRPDTPGECQEVKQGSNGTLLLTPYDPNSVMNYCIPREKDNGTLSKYDKEGVSTVYGKPPRESFRDKFNKAM